MQDNTKALPRWWTTSFLLALLALLALAAWQWRDGAPVSTDLLALLPEQHNDPLHAQAQARSQEPLNRELLLLISHADAEQGKALSQQAAQSLQDSGLFEKVQGQFNADLSDLRQQLREGRLALLPPDAQQLLLQQPEKIIAQQVQALFDPFATPSLLPVADDWFGLSRYAQHTGGHRIQLDADGRLFVDAGEQRWWLLRARTSSHALEQKLPPKVADLVAQVRQQLSANDAQLLATSGLLYAAHGQQQAQKESSLLGTISLLGSLVLLFFLLRSPRILLATLPVLVALLAGLTACVAVFGQIHILTLVLGASLIGVSLDFPLHFLSKSWGIRPWHSATGIRWALPGLCLALLTNLIGYLALGFTPFPALTQVAVFSAFGLLGAFLCTLCLLPRLLSGPLSPWSGALQLAQGWLNLRLRLLKRIRSPWLLAGLLLFCLGGLLRLDNRDDLRQWISTAPELQSQAQQTGALLGYQPTSQFFLVRAADRNQLLAREQQLVAQLSQLLEQKKLGGFQALSQFVASSEQQQRLAQALPQLLEQAQPLLEVGFPAQMLENEVKQLQQLPTLSIEQALAGPLGEPWRALWLGENPDGVASMVSLQGPFDAQAVQRASAGMSGVELIDRPAQLNQLFADTQEQAALLKLTSCLLIVLLLWRVFGLSDALRCLAIPLLSALTALACFGWLGQPLTLFAVFGLLLVTAIGVDYAILIRENVGGPAVSLLGTALSASTTWLSFGLLALSKTPAVASFGLAVSLGLLFCFLLCPWAVKHQDAHA